MKQFALLFVFVTFLGGCGDATPKAPDMGGEEGKSIALLIEDMNDAVGNPKKLDLLFVKGTRPTDVKKYAKYSYFCLGKPSVSGTTGTCQVQVESTKGEKAGEVEWGFEKEADKWKIKTAPLPQ